MDAELKTELIAALLEARRALAHSGNLLHVAGYPGKAAEAIGAAAIAENWIENIEAGVEE